jgi:hypothetical protein
MNDILQSCRYPISGTVLVFNETEKEHGNILSKSNDCFGHGSNPANLKCNFEALPYKSDSPMVHILSSASNSKCGEWVTSHRSCR